MWRFAVTCLMLLASCCGQVHSTSSPITYTCARWSAFLNVTLASNQTNSIRSKVKVQISSKNSTTGEECVRQVCEIDLTQEPRPPSTSSDMCHVVGKTGDVYTVGVIQQINKLEYGHTVQMSQMFDNTTQSTTIIGQIKPDETQLDIIKTLESGLTFQIDHETRSQAIPPSGVLNVNICENKYVPIQFCHRNLSINSMLTIYSKEHEIKSKGPCVEAGYKFDLPSDDTDVIQVMYEDATCQLHHYATVNVRKSCLKTICSRDLGSKAREIVSSSYLGRDVLCDTQTDGGNWVVFQRRSSSDVDFYLGWDNYTAGFGNLTSNFWLGLDTIYKSCPRNEMCELRIDFTFSGRKYYANYQNFYLGGPTQKFRLHIGSYSGNAQDRLTAHNGMYFTTKDKDNDRYHGNCAKFCKGAWWYYSCQMSNLNGIWGLKSAQGLDWLSITRRPGSLQLVEMKLRMYA